MKNPFGLLSVASFASVLSACGDTAWMRDLGPVDAATGNGIVCALEGAEVATVGCAATVDPGNPCADGTTGRYCSAGAIVGACHVLAGRQCHPGSNPPPVDAGTTPPPPPPPVDGGVLGPIVCTGREAVVASCNGQGCQDGVMGLNCSADGRAFEGSCHLIAGRQCWPAPLDAGTPVDTGTAPVDTGLATDGQIEVAIDQSYFAVVRNADGSSTGTPWCGGNAGSINLRCFDRTGEQIRTPLAARRVIAIDSSWVGAMRCDVTCGSGADAPVYPFPTGWRDSRYPIGGRGITLATVGRDGIGDVRASALYCNAPGGIKIEIPVQASFIGRCLQ
jgi:hypothetical protein